MSATTTNSPPAKGEYAEGGRGSFFAPNSVPNKMTTPSYVT